MMTEEQVSAARANAAETLKKAGMVITPKEHEEMEIADFGLDDFPAPDFPWWFTLTQCAPAPRNLC